jgi:hypothetical protein
MPEVMIVTSGVTKGPLVTILAKRFGIRSTVIVVNCNAEDFSWFSVHCLSQSNHSIFGAIDTSSEVFQKFFSATSSPCNCLQLFKKIAQKFSLKSFLQEVFIITKKM